MAAASSIVNSPKKTSPAHGRAVVLINAQSGTVRSMGVDAVRQILKTELAKWRQKTEFRILDGAGIEAAVKILIAEDDVSSVIAGGGDGTITSIAGQLVGTDIALGILPLGTMNLMAKSLDIGPDLAQAMAQLGNAEPRMIDVGRVGRRIFLHHLSVGIQPRMVRVREKLGYRSRLTKMLSGARAMFSIILKPQSMRLKAEIDGRPMEMKAPALVISNNRYEGAVWMKHRGLDEGLLGLYAVKPMSKFAFVKLALDMLRGRWRENLNVVEDSAQHVKIEKRRRRGGKSRAILATLDGELVLLESPVDIRIEPLALKVLAPHGSGAAAT